MNNNKIPALLQESFLVSSMNEKLQIEESKIPCQNGKNISYTFQAKVALLVCVQFFALALLATTLDLLLHYTRMLEVEEQGLMYYLRHLIHAFSLLKTCIPY